MNYPGKTPSEERTRLESRSLRDPTGITTAPESSETGVVESAAVRLVPSGPTVDGVGRSGPSRSDSVRTRAKLFITNLVLVLLFGVLLSGWIFYYTDWFEAFVGLLALEGLFSWLAFVTRFSPFNGAARKRNRQPLRPTQVMVPPCSLPYYKEWR